MPIRYVALPDLFPNQMWQVYDILERCFTGWHRSRSRAKVQRIADRMNREWRKSLNA